MTHGHEVLHMMEGNSYANKQALIDAIIERFGAEERFYTCSAEGLDARQLVNFLDDRGKLMDTDDGGFTVNLGMMCQH